MNEEKLGRNNKNKDLENWLSLGVLKLKKKTRFGILYFVEDRLEASETKTWDLNID